MSWFKVDDKLHDHRTKRLAQDVLDFGEATA